MRCVLAAVVAALPILSCGETAVTTDTWEPPAPAPAEVAAEAYDRYCALCHGADGEGYASDAANALNNQDWLVIAGNGLIRNAIARGRPGTPMSGWSEELGGPLSPSLIEGLIAHTRAWQTEPPIALGGDAVAGEAGRGAPIYQFRCAQCHGATGESGLFMSLNNPEFLANATDAYLRYSIAKGRQGTTMPPFENELTSQGIDDLVTLIRSWETAPAAAGVQAPPLELSEPVLNPGGPQPQLGETRLVPANLVLEAWNAGAELVLLDARPPSDYLAGHISGAVSVPFYAVEDALDQLPRDVWIVCYCACPHAESGIAADALEAAGFDLVRVLDEGFLVWQDLGYPVTAGPAP